MPNIIYVKRPYSRLPVASTASESCLSEDLNFPVEQLSALRVDRFENQIVQHLWGLKSEFPGNKPDWRLPGNSR